MTSLKKIIRSSDLILLVLALLVYPIIWMVIKGEGVLRRLNVYLVSAVLSVFNLQHQFGSRYYRLLSKHLMPDRLTPQIASKLQQKGLAVRTSFSSAMILRNHYHAGNILPEKKVYNKIAGARFVRALGVKTPELLYANISFFDIPKVCNAVIKPVHEGHATGVFIARSIDEILELNTGKMFGSWQQLRYHIKALLQSKKVCKDLWMVEQLISDDEGNIARDLKFFAYYGRVLWVAEAIRYPKVVWYMVDKNNNIFDSGFCKRNELFIGDGVTKEQIALAEKISLEIPAPFIRIDFLKAKDKMFFGEFTPLPGSVGRLNKDADHKNGQAFHNAQARLYADLIAGKRFSLFNEYSAEFLKEGIL